MSADFWAGYVSGALGILVGNPLDIVKTKLQAAPPPTTSPSPSITTFTTISPRPSNWTSFARGSAAPILGYGALNALLFVTYNRSLAFLTHNASFTPSPNNTPTSPAAAWQIWTAGALGGLATFFVSAPTELVKCRAQVSVPPRSSWDVTTELWRQGGVRRLYLGGGVTSLRDAVGYGFYFWSYELSKRTWCNDDDGPNQQAVKVMLCGGLAGVVTWASIFPLDVIKTRVQTWDAGPARTSITEPLLGHQSTPQNARPCAASALQIAVQTYRAEGVAPFFRGLGVCSARAFIVNAVQWAVYEYMMSTLST